MTRHLQANREGVCCVCSVAYPKGAVLVGRRQGNGRPRGGFAHLVCAMQSRKKWYADRGKLPPEEALTDAAICQILGGVVVERIHTSPQPVQQDLELPQSRPNRGQQGAIP